MAMPLLFYHPPPVAAPLHARSLAGKGTGIEDTIPSDAQPSLVFSGIALVTFWLLSGLSPMIIACFIRRFCITKRHRRLRRANHLFKWKIPFFLAAFGVLVYGIATAVTFQQASVRNFNLSQTAIAVAILAGGYCAMQVLVAGGIAVILVLRRKCDKTLAEDAARRLDATTTIRPGELGVAVVELGDLEANNGPTPTPPSPIYRPRDGAQEEEPVVNLEVLPPADRESMDGDTGNARLRVLSSLWRRLAFLA